MQFNVTLNLNCLLQVLINRLEKNRGMKPEERANIMKTLKELTEKISQLKNEISPTAQATANTTQSKSKTDVRQFIYTWCYCTSTF